MTDAIAAQRPHAGRPARRAPVLHAGPHDGGDRPRARHVALVRLAPPEFRPRDRASSTSRSSRRSTRRPPSARRCTGASASSRTSCPVPDQTTDVDRLDRVALSAARTLTPLRRLEHGRRRRLGLDRQRRSAGTSCRRRRTTSLVVQLNGAANTRTTGIVYASEILRRFGDAYGALVQQFPVPAFFDDPATKRALWRERSTRRVLELQDAMDLVVFGIGVTATRSCPSHVYSGGYLEQSDHDEPRADDGVVGDVATVFFREDGSSADITLNKRASGPDLATIRRAPRRVCVVAGEVEGRRRPRGARRGPGHRPDPRRGHRPGSARQLSRCRPGRGGAGGVRRTSRDPARPRRREDRSHPGPRGAPRGASPWQPPNSPDAAFSRSSPTTASSRTSSSSPPAKLREQGATVVVAGVVHRADRDARRRQGPGRDRPPRHDPRRGRRRRLRPPARARRHHQRRHAPHRERRRRRWSRPSPRPASPSPPSATAPGPWSRRASLTGKELTSFASLQTDVKQRRRHVGRPLGRHATSSTASPSSRRRTPTTSPTSSARSVRPSRRRSRPDPARAGLSRPEPARAGLSRPGQARCLPALRDRAPLTPRRPRRGRRGVAFSGEPRVPVADGGAGTGQTR